MQLTAVLDSVLLRQDDGGGGSDDGVVEVINGAIEKSMLQERYPLLQPFGDTLTGKVIFVTGASRGIGKAFVESFLDSGASKVYAAVRNVEFAEAAFEGRTEKMQRSRKDGSEDKYVGGTVVPIRLDMSDHERIAEIATIASDVDIVINNAGVLTRTSPLDGETTVEGLKYEMDVNVYGLARLAHAFAPVLERRGGQGIFVQLNSVASLRCAAPNMATYSASKAAAFSLTQALRQELGALGVHVISVHPGPIATDMIADMPALASVAPPASTVAKSVIDAIVGNSEPPFLVFPDKKAKGLGKTYESFAEIVIEQGNAFGAEGRCTLFRKGN